MSKREAILKCIHEVPALPVQSLKLIELIQDTNVSLAELQTLIEHDPGMTSNVLKLANSASFRGIYEIGSIKEAIVRLGARTVLQLAVASSLVPVARQPIKGYDMPAESLLAHSIISAAAVTGLSRCLQFEVDSRVFTAALLHDVGKIILGTFLEIDAEPILHFAFSKKMAFDEAERTVLGIDHPEVGAALLEIWGLPPIIVNLVRWHHQPQKASDEDRPYVEVVHVADIFSRLCGVGAGIDGLNYTTSQDALKRLRLTTQVVEQVTANILTIFSDMSATLEVCVGREDYGT